MNTRRRSARHPTATSHSLLILASVVTTSARRQRRGLADPRFCRQHRCPGRGPASEAAAKQGNATTRSTDDLHSGLAADTTAARALAPPRSSRDRWPPDLSNHPPLPLLARQYLDRAIHRSFVLHRFTSPRLLRSPRLCLFPRFSSSGLLCRLRVARPETVRHLEVR